MRVHSDIHNLPLFHNAVVTIGTFDGVHTGHRQIISQLKQEAFHIQGETVIITFHPHPRMVLHALRGKSDSIQLLNTLPEKIELLGKQGIDHLVVVPFNEDFALLSAEAYIKDFLVKRFHPRTIIIGYDHRFGKNREGDYQLMESYGKALGYQVKEIPQYILNHVAISSTTIRKALGNGDISAANEYLGYPYFMEGKVVEGNRMGRTIGFPTANLEIANPHKLVPSMGVYAIQVSMEGYPGTGKEKSPDFSQGPIVKGMLNIGTRPTVGGSKMNIEANLFDYEGDLYGKSLRVYFRKYLREERKFENLEKLKSQLNQDRSLAKEILGSYLSSEDPLMIL